MSHIPEKVHNQRMKLQLQSIESPSELPGRKLHLSDGLKSKSFPGGMIPNKLRLQLDTMDSPVHLTGYRKTDMSPVTDLAFNLCDTSLSSPNTPQMIIKKKLTMDYESSPSPSSSHCSSDSGTPLTSITNRPKGRLMGSGRSITRCPTEPLDLEANKENIPMTKLMSPCKTADSPSTLKDRKSFNRMIHSPEKEKINTFQSNKTISQKRPLFTVLEDENSKDSGYSSQPLEEDRHRKKSRCDMENSLEDILADCSPSKEGLAVLQRSPCSKQTSKASSDGFDVESLDSLPEMPEEEDEEDSSYTNSFSALLQKEILSSSTSSNSFLTRTSCISSPSPSGPRSIRRALSMIAKPTCLEEERSPLSRNEFKAGFKRPEAPCVSTNIPTFGRKKRHPGLVERSISLQQPYFPHSGKTLMRSQSEVAIKKSFEFKDDNDDILPDSYGKYCLPSGTGLSKNHPNLRSITCHTLADLIAGKHKDSVNSFRVIDVRYKFEYEGGHILGAENWQHGEDEEFLSGLLPAEPLECPPSPGDVKNEKRNIVIFHCEFSSQRAPDFYKKLRERDRTLNENVYPGLHYPEIYLLHLGYKEFYNNYPALCTGRYTEMADPRYGNELRQMRAKSKSWSGGTAARTGALARRFP